MTVTFSSGAPFPLVFDVQNHVSGPPIRLEAIDSRLEAIPSRLEAIASRLEAILVGGHR